MDQQHCNPIHCKFGSCRSRSGCSSPLVRRRRRSLALATAVLAASASTTAAFSPSSSANPLSCYYTAQQSPFPDDFEQSTARRSSQRQRSLHVLTMVSFLELEVGAPTTTSPPKRKNSPARTNGRIRKAPAKESRITEIDIQPDYGFLGPDAFYPASSPSERSGSDSAYDSEIDAAASSNRHVPAIDSEFLYEGITSGPSQPASEKVTTAATAATSLQKGAQNKPTTTTAASADSQANTKTDQPKQTTNSKSTTTKKTNLITTKKTKSKSSTMPGFIKDNDLDAHIAQRGLSRLPSTTDQRQLTRMIHSKSARIQRRAASTSQMYKKSAAVPDSLLDYAQEIHAISRVTPKEEKELGTKTQEAIRLQRLHNDLQVRYGRDPTDDEWCAAAGKINVVALKEAIEDGMRAKNQLVASNLRMVQRVVNLYIRNGLGSEYNAGDLMQDGTMALIRAAEKYEPERGFRFSTYAMYWIRSAVKRSQTSQSRIVPVPQRIHETHKRISKQEAHLRKELARAPTKDELSSACDITVLQLDRCRKAMSQVTFSLDAEMQNHHKPNNASSRKDTMYDIVEGQVDETEYERSQRLLMKEHLIGTLRRYLSPHEVDLLLLRYGLMDERALPKGMSGPLTIAEVSKLVGLKPDKVRRIIINSQKQLRHLMKEWEDFGYELA
eukprot:CAMPEP_0201875408 /NCGR_PEP_ID=MMETSP0902-20130614/7393_1 /ASSEMBLY_ACC=CAM_ASM_000551 /TAXON_ID=420261 /ORGANISM="Thalassiosira antarctica, Strain CCMP982" /LENGTH=667 /DNA_ID=CAMNT_0048402459 /DNA_START=86 /DNA_END=2089 /DNA_ORIENTATION=-